MVFGLAWRSVGVIAAGIGYLDEGAGSPLVLVMGLGARASAWAPHTRSWARSHRCISVDNRGAGETPVSADLLSTSAMAGDIVDLIEELELGTCDIAGISMGAGIAQEVAIRRPDLVRRLVLVAPWARCDLATRSTLGVLGRVRRTGDVRAFNELLRNTVWTHDWVNQHWHEMEPDLDVEPEMSQFAFELQVLACQDHNALDRLHSIAAPTLVTLGDQDRFIRPQLSVEVAESIPFVEARVFEGLGHVHHWEALDEFNELVERWLE